ncbi:C4-type zinc ribbon domain-containing protein [Desulfuromonas sp.]|uniref:zinc ribbon domain-containing protein n=1 Tax=Desulfuromonas sp. TaxID=892 RepID=UPI0025C06C00|nr:C4-type zinc ribbon domain-containing protein [Desulfuromonas sp.]
MQEKMGLLIELQELDREMIKTRENRREFETEQASLAAELETVQSMLDSLVDEIEALQAQHKELRQALEIEQANIEKAEGRLPAIKTQKEYVAVLKEVDTAKKLNKEIQDRIEAKNAEIEVLDKDRQEKSGEVETIASRVKSRNAEIASSLADYDQVLGESDGKRKVLLDQIPSSMRKRYQMLLDRRGGLAVVEARRGTCLGCNMHLPPQLFNSLLRRNEIYTCPHCNRLLYVHQEQ